MAPSGHRRNLQPKSSAEIFSRAVPIVSIKLVGPNTAVFGIIIVLYLFYSGTVRTPCSTRPGNIAIRNNYTQIKIKSKIVYCC